MTVMSRVIVGVWLATLALSGWLIQRTPITTDLTALLPPSAGRVQHLLISQLRDGVAARLILVGLGGAEPDALAKASRQIARHMQDTGLFDYVNNGEAGYSNPERDMLMRHRYVLSPAVTADRFTPASLRESLEQDLRILGSPLGAVLKTTLPADPTRELLQILTQLSSDGGPPSQHGVWFSPDGRQARLVAQTSSPGFDIDGQQRAIETIRKAAVEAGLPESGLVVSGPGVFAVESRATIEQDSWRLSLIAAGVVTAILLSVYRSSRVIFLSLLPVLSGLLVGIAAVGALFGSVHGITLGFGATLIGEAVDYPTYLFTHVATGESVRDALIRILPTLRLAVLTTVFGGLAMLLSSFTGLSQLGMLSMTGTLVAGMVTRWVLPVLAPHHVECRSLPVDWTRMLRASGRGGTWAAWTMVGVALTVLVVHRDNLWDDDLANLSPVSEEAKARDQQLRTELGAPDVRYLVVVVGSSQEDALARSESTAGVLRSLSDRGMLSGFDAPNLYLPSRETQLKRLAVLPDPPTLQAALAEAQRGLPFRQGLFVPFLKDVEQARTGRGLELSDLQGSALSLKIHSLLLRDGDDWVALMPLRGVENDTELARQIGSTDSRVFLLDLKEESNRLVNGYRHESLRLTALGLVAIAMVLWWGLKSPARVARVLSPVLIAVLLSVAALTLLGERLSLFHLVSLLLVVGIGLNYALFFNRDASSHTETRRTVLSLTVCGLATLSAFGALASSSTPVLHAIGITVCLGCVFSLAISAMLAKPLGAS